MLKDRIKQRQKLRSEIASRPGKTGIRDDALLLISESIDEYIEQRIETDKVLTGILKDIQGDIACINLRQEVKGTIADETDPANTR